MSRRPARSTVVAYTTLVRSGGEAGRLPESGGVDRGGQRGRGVGLADNLGHSRRSGGVEVAVIGVAGGDGVAADRRSEEDTSEPQSRPRLVCRPLPEKKKSVGEGD